MHVASIPPPLFALRSSISSSSVITAGQRGPLAENARGSKKKKLAVGDMRYTLRTAPPFCCQAAVARGVTRHTYLIGSLWRVPNSMIYMNTSDIARASAGAFSRSSNDIPRVLIEIESAAQDLTSQRIRNYILPKLPENKGDDAGQPLVWREGTFSWTSCSVSRKSWAFPIPSALIVRK
jgi:hypothetical protein